MSKKINEQYDHRKIPILGLVPESASSAPSSPVAGQLWYDTSVGVLKYWNGSAWLRADQVGAELTANKGVASGYASLDGSTKVPIAQIPTGTTGTTVPFGNDSRFTDQRVPTDGSVTGGTAGAGVKIAANTITAANIANATITDVQVAAANKDGAAGTASMRTLGTGSAQAAAGNDARFTDTRTPTAGSVVPASFNATAIDPVAGTAGARTLGFGAQQALAGTSRLDQIAAPTANVSLNSNRITNLAASTTGTDAVNRAELDAAMQGIKGVKDPVRVAAQANVNLASPGTTVDSVTMVAGDRFLAPSQTTGTQNGIYVWNGSAVAATRAPDADATGEVLDGTTVAVAEGTNAGAIYMQTATPSGAPGAWTQTWTIFNTGGTTYTAGNGLQLSSNTFSVKKDTTDPNNYITVTSSGIGVGTTPVALGGTGGTTAAAARTNLSSTANALPQKFTQTYTTAIVAGTPFTITHNLGTQAVVVSFRNTATNEQEDFLVTANGTNTIQVTSDFAIASPSYEITVIG